MLYKPIFILFEGGRISEKKKNWGIPIFHKIHVRYYIKFLYRRNRLNGTISIKKFSFDWNKSATFFTSVLLMGEKCLMLSRNYVNKSSVFRLQEYLWVTITYLKTNNKLGAKLKRSWQIIPLNKNQQQKKTSNSL